jgi:hypothetical protein
MKLKGVLDFSLGNFLCLRGFARLGDLYSLSEPDPSFQRDLLKLHEKEMVAFRGGSGNSDRFSAGISGSALG